MKFSYYHGNRSLSTAPPGDTYTINPSRTILIDAHMVGEKETGNETYLLGLLQGLEQIRPQETILVAVTDAQALIQRLGTSPSFETIKVSSSPWKRLLLDLPGIVRARNVDLAHVTYIAPPNPGCACIVSVHDVAFLRHPEWFSLRDRLVLNLGVGRSTKKAHTVIAISEYTRGELIDVYALQPKNIPVIPLAARVPFLDPGINPARTGPPYFLAVGNLQPRKNLFRLLQAFALVLKRGPGNCRLKIVGKAGLGVSFLHQEVNRLELNDNVEFTGYVEDAELARLYAGSLALVYPSLYEGFGLPVLEAMAAGAPVITSTVSSLPEVAGDAALLVDPRDVPALADTMSRVQNDTGLRVLLRNKGQERARMFSWEETARRTLDVYRGAFKPAG